MLWFCLLNHDPAFIIHHPYKALKLNMSVTDLKTWKRAVKELTGTRQIYEFMFYLLWQTRLVTLSFGQISSNLRSAGPITTI